jgi:cytochrome c oxidase subunit II
MQSTLSPHGPAAAGIAELSWVLFAGGAAILALVVLAIVLALQGRRWMARERFVAAAGIAFPVVTLSALLVYVYALGERLQPGDEPVLRIEVIAEQWWWRIRYEGEDFETANEIRIPAAKTVALALRSADVIHSFWVPALAGKVDMVPGRTNHLRLHAIQEGVFRGQCAEFCGGPHALMALHVVAQSDAEFQAWRERQRRAAASGNALFNARCGACHSVRGTQARGTLGPDLTHVASRLYLAAGTLPNSPANVAAWLADSQHAKPGSLMPSMRLSAAELQSLSGYVATLR